jgi:hypothetical protein
VDVILLHFLKSGYSMTNIFTLEKFDNFSEKINLDELYEKKQQSDLNKLVLFNKILNRVHTRIKTMSKQRVQELCCWYVVPEIIIGVPKYDQAGCIAYIMDKLTTNGFIVKYIHPNTLFISWNHWVPSYVRSELKKKTGIVIDEYGNKVEEEKDKNGQNIGSNKDKEPKNPDEMMFNFKDNGSSSSSSSSSSNKNKKFTPINSYKSSGNLVYNKELLDKVGDRFT